MDDREEQYIPVSYLGVEKMIKIGNDSKLYVQQKVFSGAGLAL